jgi:chromosome segregation ATPase
MASEAGDLNGDEREAPKREVRIDAPHGVRRAGSPEPKPRAVHVAMGPSLSVHAAGEQAFEDAEAQDLPPWPGAESEAPLSATPIMLAQHAADLAERLQQRLGEVDRRESRLNSQEAEFDTRIRNARLWIDQRETELSELQTRLETWEEQLSERQESAAAQLEEADELAQRLKELSERERAIASKELELELGLTEQQTKLDSLDFETASCRTRQHELDQARQRCEQRQRELDQREAKIYVEHERGSHERLALDARQAELATRETRLTAQEAKLAEYERRLAEQAGEIEFQRAELQQARTSQEERAAATAADERRLEFRQREIETALLRFERLGIVELKMAEIEELGDALAMRSNYLDNAEAMLAERQMQLSEAQRELEHDRLAFENRVTGERRALAAESQETQAKYSERQARADRREAELDRREQALEQIAEQLRGAQRETLETRLAMEETWLQLQGVLAPTALTRSIGQLRSRLADHFKLESEEIRRQRGELEAVRRELAEQLSTLQHERQEIQRWSELREQDVEQRAARLVAREAELDAQQRHYEFEQRQWEAQRGEYQGEIQRLLGQLRGGPLKTAA